MSAREDFDYASAMDTVVMLVRMAASMDVDIDRLTQEHARAESIGPLLDPTAWMQGGAKRLDDQREILRVALPFVRASREIIARHEADRAAARFADAFTAAARATPAGGTEP